MEKMERNKEILIRYAIYGQTMQEIGDYFEISRERVRQVLAYLGVSNKRQNNLKVRAQRLYDFLIEYKIDHNGNSPTVIEMRDSASLSKSGRVQGVLRILENIGLIRMGKTEEGNNRRWQIEIIGSEWVSPKNMDFVSAYNRILDKNEMSEYGN